MPSTVVHVALAGLIGTALLGRHFETRAIVIVMGVCALIDLDTLVGIYVPGTHRAAFHTLFVVLIPATLLLWDVRVREKSDVYSRWGADGVRLAWVTLVTVLFAHILLDAFFNGVNLFWPVHDRFYDLSGELLVSDQRGIVQTFFGDGAARGTTEDTHYYTGFDPAREEPPEDVERIFPVAGSGERFVLTIAGFGTVLFRIVAERRNE